jgi:hypothetical protein
LGWPARRRLDTDALRYRSGGHHSRAPFCRSRGTSSRWLFLRLIGTAIVEHFGKDHTGERYGAHFWPPAFVAATTATFDEALEREAPLFDEFVFRSPTGVSHAVSRLVCPLKGDGARSPPMVIQTRIHRYDGKAVRLPSLPDKAWGELLGRRQIASLDELERVASEWWTKAAI